ncbi:hypothetical protein [uncultured Arenimonas sp.]|uniref:hypothetical protein n=1 Tax=uncultured Arenimonas sp. TaxID=546226 RepID=UPI0030D8BC36
MARLLVPGLLSLLILGCAAPPAPPAEAQAATVPASEAVPVVVQADAAIAEVVEQLPLPEPTPVVVPPEDPPLISDDGAAFIIRWEVGSPELYTRKFQRPVCPMCDRTASGPTIGIGYDLGHMSRAAVDMDWPAHPQQLDLYQGLGFTGRAAIPVTEQLQHIVTPYPLAFDVFQDASIVKYWRACRRAFGEEAWDQAPMAVTDMLLDTCYNRGFSMTGAKRVEMRDIRDDFLPNKNWWGVADAIRRMERHWPTVRGLQRRRNEAADFILARL